MAFRSLRGDPDALADRARLIAARRDPDTRPLVREERLRGSGSAIAGFTLSCWRGVSGRRYVVCLYDCARDPRDIARIDPTAAVVLAVHRPDTGPPRILAAGHRGTIGQALRTWIPLGTSELHVHRSGLTAMHPDAIVEDLIDAG